MNGSRKSHARTTNDDLFQSSQLSNASSCIIGYGNESQDLRQQGPYGMSLTMSVGEQNDSSQSGHDNAFSSSLPGDDRSTGDIYDCDEDSLDRGYRRNESRVKSNKSRGGAFDDLERLAREGGSISGSDDEYQSSECDGDELKDSNSILRLGENESDRPNAIVDNLIPSNHSSSLCYAESSPRKDSMEGDNDSLQSPTNSISQENQNRHVYLDKTPNTSMANNYNRGGNNRSQEIQTYPSTSIVSAKSQSFKTPRTMEQLLQKQRKRIISNQRTSTQKYDRTPRRVSTTKKINTTTSTTSTRSLDNDDFTSRLIFKNGKLKSSIKRRPELSQMSPSITQTQSFPRSGSIGKQSNRGKVRISHPIRHLNETPRNVRKVLSFQTPASSVKLQIRDNTFNNTTSRTSRNMSQAQKLAAVTKSSSLLSAMKSREKKRQSVPDTFTSLTSKNKKRSWSRFESQTNVDSREIDVNNNESKSDEKQNEFGPTFLTNRKRKIVKTDQVNDEEDDTEVCNEGAKSTTTEKSPASPYKLSPQRKKKRKGIFGTLLQSIRSSVDADEARLLSGNYPYRDAEQRKHDANDPRNRAHTYMDVTIVGHPRPMLGPHALLGNTATMVGYIHQHTRNDSRIHTIRMPSRTRRFRHVTSELNSDKTEQSNEYLPVLEDPCYAYFCFKRDSGVDFGSKIRIYNPRVLKSDDAQIKHIVLSTNLCECYPSSLPTLYIPMQQFGNEAFSVKM